MYKKKTSRPAPALSSQLERTLIVAGAMMRRVKWLQSRAQAFADDSDYFNWFGCRRQTKRSLALGNTYDSFHGKLANTNRL